MKAKVSTAHKSHNVAPAYLTNSTWPSGPHSSLRSQPGSDHMKSLYMFSHHLVIWKWNKLLCDFVFNEIRNRVCHCIPSMKMCMKWRESWRAENPLLCSLKSLFIFWLWISHLLFNLLLIQFPHFKSGDNNGTMS